MGVLNRNGLLGTVCMYQPLGLLDLSNLALNSSTERVIQVQQLLRYYNTYSPAIDNFV